MENNIEYKTKQAITYTKMIKPPRSITMSENWKKREIKHVLELRDEMLANNIDETLIKKYVDEQYYKINQEYESKINKYLEKQKKQEDKKLEKDIKEKRKKAIQFLLKNKEFLEEKGANKEYIKKYVDTHYNQINQLYILNNSDPYDTIDLDTINFLDL
jgi:hypothetical protein